MKTKEKTYKIELTYGEICIAHNEALDLSRSAYMKKNWPCVYKDAKKLVKKCKKIMDKDE